jgi:hypothetical protein
MIPGSIGFIFSGFSIFCLFNFMHADAILAEMDGKNIMATIDRLVSHVDTTKLIRHAFVIEAGDGACFIEKGKKKSRVIE